MALSLENANLVRMKVKQALASGGSATNGVGADPAIAEAAKDLFVYLSSQRLNPDLMFVPFSAAQLIANGGAAMTDAACKLVAIYLKGRRTSGTTESFVTFSEVNQAGAIVDVSRFNATTNSPVLKIFPKGQAIATALHASAATAAGGATESSEADAADGFVIVAAA